MRPYSPFGKSIHQINTPDLQTLKETTEGWYIEYKRESPNASGIAKSISAFANTYGGWLFIGVDELSKENSVAGAFPGIPKAEADATLQRIRKSAADMLNPAPHFESKILCGPEPTIDLPSDRVIICVWVPRSSNTPHVHKSGVIYRRVSDSSEPKPENDRFILDKLWQRADEKKRLSREWHERDPEFSEEEKNQPYIRLMLVADKWSEQDVWIDAEIEVIRKIFSENGQLPFDTVNTSSEGFIARQLHNNNPQNLTLTWRLRRNFSSDIIIPLPHYTPKQLTNLLEDLQGYKNSIEFIKILQKYKTNKVKIVDLNYIFNIFTGITKIQSELAKIIGWKKSYHAKIKILNAWRTIPFIDIIEVITIFEKNGPAMLLDSVTSIPSGTDPESFFKISNFEEIEVEEVKSIVQATTIFMPLALSFGLPMWIHHDEGSTATPYHETLMEAGHRAINIVQPLRNKRLQALR